MEDLSPRTPASETAQRLSSPPALDALADPTRRLIIELLAQRPLTVRELCHLTGHKQPALSKHLRVLRDTRLVSPRRTLRDGRARVYELRREPLMELEAWLTNIRTAWNNGVHFTPISHDDIMRPIERFTTRGTPRLRNRFQWRAKDAGQAADPDQADAELAKIERDLRDTDPHVTNEPRRRHESTQEP